LTVNIELCGEAWKRGKDLFRAEPHKSYIYRQYTNIVFILQQNLSKFFLISFNNKKKITETPIDTSIVVPVRDVA
jgi:hypothetical protein